MLSIIFAISMFFHCSHVGRVYWGNISLLTVLGFLLLVMTSINRTVSSNRIPYHRIVVNAGLLSRSNLLSGCFQNIGGLVSNFDEVVSLLSGSRLSFAGFAETFLDEFINDSIVNIANYNLIRKDRTANPMAMRSRGGVAIYLRKGINFRLVQLLYPNSFLLK